MIRYLVGISLLLFAALATALWGIGSGWPGVRQDAGEVTARPLPNTAIDERVPRQHSARQVIADRAGAEVPHTGDRAEGLTPHQRAQTKRAVRQSGGA